MRSLLRACLRWMRKRWKLLSALAAIMLVLAAYPTFVLGYTWLKVAQSDLPGGRHGPLDAYRHTLASAVVAYTLNEGVVEWVTLKMERKDTATHRMDRHNNRIGAKIGSKAKRFRDIEPAVAKQVAEGRAMTGSPDQSTWLPKPLWKKGKMW